MYVDDVDLGARWMTRRDPGAFQALVLRYAGPVYGTCRRVLGNATEAEDVAQECFEILAGATSWPQGSLGAWLHRVAVNRALNRLKSERRRHEREERYVRERSPQAEGDWNDVYRYVDEAIAALPDKYRGPLVSCYIESQSHATIAENLGIPRRTVTHRIGKGVELIRKSLRKRGIPVASASLAAMLGANLAEAAPARLTASLGRLALAGVKATEAAAVASTTPWLAVGGTILMWQKSITVGVVLVLLAVFGWFWFNDSDAPPPAHRATHAQSSAAPRSNPAAARQARFAKEPVAGAKMAVAKTVATEKASPSADTATVRGYVVDETGDAVPGVAVRVQVSEDGMDFRTLASYKTKTDANGEFTVENIRQFGHEKAYANCEGYLQASSGDLDLKAGVQREDVCLLLKETRYSISGWVLDTGRRPIPDAEVCLRHYKMKWPMSGQYFTGTAKLSSAYTDDKGWFVLGVPANANCDLTVLKQGYGAGYYMSVGAGTDDAAFVLTRGGSIAGKVVRPDGSGVAKAELRAVGKADLGGEPKGVMPADVRPPSVITNDDGTYRIDGLGPDYEYTVEVDEDSIPGFAAAPRDGVKVVAERTTSSIDFTLQGLQSVRIHGKATDSASGKPASPIRVKATVVNPGDDFAGDRGETVETDPDGEYTLTLDVARAIDVRIVWSYTDGANVYPKNNSTGGAKPATPGERGVEVKVLRGLQPGGEETLDFKVDSPIVVPVRFVDPVGKGMEGLEVGIRQESAAWGTSSHSDSDGRVTYLGLGPYAKFHIQAIVQEPERMVVGESEVFSGTPGQKVPEVTVVCRYRGGVEGVLVDASGKPVADTEIGCTAVRADGRPVTPATITTREDGSFVISHALPYDSYLAIAVGYARDDKIEVGILKDVEITPNTVLNLGTIRCEPMLSVEEAIAAAEEVMKEQEE
jgi:RNA polymerase sigma factor (sigma-70 family)